jgi:hypothetical protein
MRKDLQKIARSRSPERNPAETAAIRTPLESKNPAPGNGQNNIDQLLTDFLSELNKISANIAHSESGPGPHPLVPDNSASTDTSPASRQDEVPEFLQLISNIQTEHLAQGEGIVDPAHPAPERKAAPEARAPDENSSQGPSDSASAGTNEKREEKGEHGAEQLQPLPYLESRHKGARFCSILDRQNLARGIPPLFCGT